MKETAFKIYRFDNERRLFADASLEDSKTGNDSGFYYLSNDVFDLKDIKKRKVGNIIGVANFDFLHVLYSAMINQCDPDRIIAFDINEKQLIHFHKVLELIKSSAGRIDFLERFFCIELNDKSRNMLEKLRIRNACNLNRIGTGFINFECDIWNNIKFNKDAFKSSYGLDTEMTKRGIIIKSNVLGGFGKYLATIVADNIYDEQVNVMSLRFGRSFLESEESFTYFKKFITSKEMIFCISDASEELLSIILSFRYTSIILWTSNIFIEYFAQKEPELKNVAKKLSEYAMNVNILPQLDIQFIYDKRTPSLISAKYSMFRKFELSPHYYSFNAVNKEMLTGRSLEIVNVENWVKQDSGKSKLPDCEYIMLADFINSTATTKYRNIFFHILIGHGSSEDDFVRAFQKAREVASQVLVLEHNCRSVDFLINKVREMIINLEKFPGFVKKVKVRGKISLHRNTLFLYKGLKE